MGASKTPKRRNFRGRATSFRRSAPPDWKTQLRCSTALVPLERMLVPAMLAGGLLGSVSALANPLGGQVVGGAASISQPSPTQTTINQSSQSTVINWQSFNIPQGSQVDFNQPNASSVALNRDLSTNASTIAGQLKANGQVWIVNPNGVAITPTAQVNVGGLVATTSNISNSNFLAGIYKFDQPGKPTASVVNQGHVTVAQAGLADFVAPSVANSGVIQAKLGKVNLASGSAYTIDLYGDGLIKFAVSDQTAATVSGTRVSNTGTIDAAGGTVTLSVSEAESIVDNSINAGGTIAARSVGGRTGSITVDGNGGTAIVSGTLDASGTGAGQTGGTVKVLGGQVGLTAAAKIDVSGNAGGGNVAIGGDFHGAGPDADATNTVIEQGATIDADALGNGNGGQVAVWSNDTTSFGGTISAKGGSQGGNGGYVETSSGGTLTVTGLVDAGAPKGMSGQWLLDPDDLTIDATAAATIDGSLASTDVTVQTSSGSASGPGVTNPNGTGNITVASDLTWSAGHTLTLSAYNNINIDAQILVTGGGGLILDSNNAGANSNAALNFGGQGNVQFTDEAASPSLKIGADGTDNTYTLLYSMNGIQGMSSTGFYALAAPIDASGSGTIGAPPVGIFSGTFNGLGNTISNLTIDNSIYAYIGLFGEVDSGGTIANLGLIGASVTSTNGYPDVGAMVGYNDGGKIEKAYATGTVNGGSADNVGGLVGRNSGTIENAYFTGTVIAGNEVGGLVGWNDGGTIEDAYVTGTVTAGNEVGGLVGANQGTVEDAYAIATVSASGGHAGGLIGANYNTITNGYWDSDTSSAGIGMEEGGSETGGGGVNTATLETSPVLTALNSSSLGTVWGNVNNQTTPYLLNLTGNPQTVFVAGAGTTPYQLLFTLGQVQNINNNLSGDFALANGLDAATDPTMPASWSPIGESTEFTGTFNGLGNTISNLTITDSTDGYVGLFGQIGGTVANLGLIGGSVSGMATDAEVGFLAGRNGGTIEDAYTTGEVSAAGSTSKVGGLVGDNSYIIEDVYATGAVNGGGTEAGGLVGFNLSGTISYAYATGTVTGAGAVGGLVGGNTGFVTNSYYDTDTTSATGAGTGEATAGPTGLEGATILANLNASSLGTVWGNVNNQTTPYLLNLTNNPQTVFVAGAATTPYQLLFNMGQVQNINANLSGDYALAYSLNTATDPSTPASWSPIGESGSGFTGTFNGLDNTISNLTITDSTDSYVGLFGQIGSSGKLANLGLVGGSVTGGDAFVGGLVGSNQGTIEDVYATGTVTSTSLGSAGGGVVGQNVGIVEDAYATGNVSGYSYAGGVVGSNGFGGTIEYAYATGVVSGSGNVGGLVGYNNGGTITNAYWDSDSNPYFMGGGGTEESTANLEGSTILGDLNSSPLGTVWGNVNNQTTPYLLNLTSNPQTVFVAGAATTPYQLLFTLGQVQNINNNLSGDYALANSLNAATDPTTPASWSPIAGNSLPNFFTGTFNGLGNTISNLTISSGDAFVGLFGLSSGTIENIGLLGGSVSGTAYGADVGALVGSSSGTVENAYATGMVSGVGGSTVGGLVGYIDGGMIANSYATGAVSGGTNSIVGGLVGQNYNATIEDAYATGAVNGSYVGGLVGQNNGTIQDVYATGAVSGGGGSSGFPGGLVGYNAGPITNGYWDTDTSGTGSGMGYDTDSQTVTALTTAQLQYTTTNLPTGVTYPILDGNFSGGAAGGQTGLFPYLVSFYPATPQAISGIAYSDAGNTAIVAGSVTGLVGGASIGSVSTGANGYYYFLEPAGTISSGGSAVVAFTSTGISFQETATASLSGFDIYGTYLWERASSTTLSALSTDLSVAEGSATVPTGLANQRIDFSGSGFDIDQSLDLTGALVIDGSGDISQSAGSLTVGGTLSGSATGNVALNNSSNLIATLGAFSAGTGNTNYFELIDDRALNVTGAVSAGGTIGLSTGTGGIALQSNLTGGAVLLDAQGPISQIAGSIVATDLIVSAVGNVTLTQANSVTNIAADVSGGDFDLLNSSAFAIASLSDTAGTLSVPETGLTIGSGTIRLATNTGSITQGSGDNIGAANLLVEAGLSDTGATSSNVTLNNSGNGITADIAGSASGAFSFENNAAFTVGSVTGVTNIPTVTSIATTNGDLTLDAAGTLTLPDALSSGGAISLQATNNDAIDLGANLTAANAITLGGAVTLTATPITLTTSSNGAVTFDSTVGGPGDALSVGTGSGNIAFDNTVGASGSLLGAIALTTSGTTLLGGAVYAASLDASLATGAITLDGGVTTANAQTYGGAVTLGATPIALTTSSNGAVTFDSTVGGAGDALSLSTGSGNVAFDSTVGASGSSLGAIGLTTSGTTLLGGAVYAASLDASNASGAITLDGGVTTANAQTYGGAVTLGATPIALTTSSNGAVTFDSTVGGAGEALSLSTGSGNVAFDSTVGASGSSLGAITLTTSGTTLLGGAVYAASLDASNASGAITLDGGVTTANAQTYGGAVTLGATPIALTTSNNGAVTFDSTVEGAGEALSLSTGSGNVAFDSTVGASGSSLGAITLTTSGTTLLGGAVYAASLDASNATGAITLDGRVTTTNAQTYGGAVTLGADATLKSTGSGNITFDSTMDGDHNLTVATDGTTTFEGLVGTGTALTTLTVEGASSTLAGTTDLNIATTGTQVTTIGAQSYDNAVLLTANTTLQSDMIMAAPGAITFASTVDGGFSLTAKTNGTTTFDAAVGGTPLTSLTTEGVTTAATGTTDLNGGSITTTGAQSYDNAVLLTANTTLQSDIIMAVPGAITFASTVDGGFSLTAKTNGTTTFDAAVGGTPLTSLTTEGVTTAATGTTDLNGGSVTTTGAQSYDNSVTLSTSPTILTTSNALVTLGPVAGSGDTLTISSGSGGLTLNGVTVGVLNLTTTGPETLNAGTYQIGSDGSSQTYDSTGGVNLNGSITLDNATTIGSGVSAVTLAGDTTLTGGTSSDGITFAGTVDGGHNLTVDGSETAIFQAPVGGGVPLNSLAVNTAADLNGNTVTTSGAQTYGGAVTLGTDNNLTAATVTFDTTVGGAHNLTVTGAGVFDGAVNIASLDVTGTSALDGNTVTTSGTQTYGGAVTLGTDNNLTAATVTFDTTVGGAHNLTVTGAGVFDGAVNIASLDVTGTSALDGNTVTTSGAQTYGGAVTLGTDNNLTAPTVTFDTTVGGAHNLTVTGAGIFDGGVNIASLDVTGTSALDGNTVTTSGTQTYGGAVTLGTDNNLTAATVTFDTTVGGAHNLTVTGAGVFDGGVNIASLDVTGTSALDGNTVTTSGTQTYGGAVTLGTDNNLTAATVTFDTTVGGAHNLTVTGAGVFDGAVNIASLDVTGTSALDGNTVTTSGTQTYGGAVTLGTDNNLTAATVTFDTTVGGAHNLTVTGAGVFDGAVNIASLDVTGTSALDGDTVTTSGAQTYGGAVTLGTDNNLTAATVTFDTTVGGAHNLTVTGAGIFDGAVNIASLDVTGTSALDGNTVTTSGTQTYGGAVTLGTDNNLTAATVTFDTTVGGAHNLTVTGAGVFDGAVNIASLDVTGTSALDGNTVTTSGAQTYGGAVTLGTDNNLTAPTVTFDTTVGGAHNLTVTGAGIFDGGVNIASLDVTGTSALDGNTVTTSGTQTYGGAVTLGTDNNLTAPTVTFDTTVGGAHNLTVTGAGVFDGAVNIASLDVTGTSALDGNTVITSGTQTYGGPVMIGSDSLSANIVLLNAQNIDFTSAVDDAVAGRDTLLVDGGGGSVIFAAAVGGIKPLNVLQVSNMSTVLDGNVTTSYGQTYSGPVSIGANDVVTSGAIISFFGTLDDAAANTHSLTASITGSGGVSFSTVGANKELASLAVNGQVLLTGDVTTGGFQTYNGAVFLYVPSTSLTTTNALVTLGPVSIYSGTPKNGSPDAALTVNSGSGGVTLNGVTAGGLTLITSGLETVNTGTYDINGGGGTVAFVSPGGVNLDGVITLDNPSIFGASNAAVALTANTTLMGGSASDTIDFAGTLDGNFALNVTGSQTTILDPPIGSGTPLASIDIAGPAEIQASATTVGLQTYGGAVTLAGDATLTSTGGANVTFGSTIDGAHNLTTVTDGTVTFDGLIGNSFAVSSLTTEGSTHFASGTTDLNIAAAGTQVITTGSQAYDNAVMLTDDATLKSTGGGNIIFASTADGTHNLTASTDGTVTFDGLVGNGAALASLTTEGSANLSLGSTDLAIATGTIQVKTTGAQTYDNAVILTDDARFQAANVTFASTVNGARNLTAVTDGTATFEGLVGSGTALASLTTEGSTSLASGTTDLNIAAAGTQVLTSGAQNYDNAVLLTDDATVKSSGGGNITFAATVGGAHSLTTVTDGTVTLYSLGGSGLAPSSVTTEGSSSLTSGTTDLAIGSITTTGPQSYENVVELTGATTLTTSNSAVTLGIVRGGVNALTISTGTGPVTLSGITAGALMLNTTGVETLNPGTYDIDGGTGALTFNSAGGVDLGGAITLDNATTFGSSNSAVTLIGNTSLTGSASDNIIFAGTVDAATAGGESLTTVANGTVTFDRLVGHTAALASLTTEGSTSLTTGTTDLNIATAGTQVITTGAQTFNDPVVLSAAAALTSTGSGNVTFASTVNGGFALGVNTAGTTAFDGAVGGTTALASVTTDAPGVTDINGGTIRTTGTQTFNDPVILSAAAALTSTGSGNVTFASTVNGGFALGINTAGTTGFDGSVGGTTALASVTTDAPGLTDINGGTIRTTGTQTFNDPVVLSAAAALTSTGGGNVTFASTVNGGFALGVNTAGTTAFDGAVGGTTALASVTTDAPGVTDINGGTIRTTGTQTFNDPVILSAAAALTSTGSGNVTFASTVNGGFALGINTAGTTGFDGSVGGTTALASVTTDAPGLTDINGGTIRTTGTQTFNDPVVLSAAAVLTSTGSGNVTFASTVNGGFALGVNTAGTTAFDGAVGGTTALASVTTDAPGVTDINGGTIRTTGTQTFNDPVILSAAAALTSTGSGNVTFASTVNGGFALGINTAGTTGFDGSVGGTTALASVTTDAPGLTDINGGTIRTTGAQTFNDPVILSAAAALTSTGSGNVTFASTVNGGFALGINTAGTTGFDGSVGGTAALVSVTTDAPGLTDINGGTIRTTGTQTFNDPVILSAAATLISNNNGNVTFGGSVTAPYTLTVLTGGTTAFNGNANFSQQIDVPDGVIVNCASCTFTVQDLPGGTLTNDGTLVNVSVGGLTSQSVSEGFDLSTQTGNLHINGFLAQDFRTTLAISLSPQERAIIGLAAVLGLIDDLEEQINRGGTGETAAQAAFEQFLFKDNYAVDPFALKYNILGLGGSNVPGFNDVSYVLDGFWENMIKKNQ